MSTQEQNITYFEWSKHRNMWNWLAEHPGKDKDDYLQSNPLHLDKDDMETFLCVEKSFPCLYAAKVITPPTVKWCFECPLKDTDVKAKLCGDLVYQWKMMGKIYLHFCTMEKESPRRSVAALYREYMAALATEIRDICTRVAEFPVKSKVPCR